jgi:sulfur carrier protein
LIALTVNGERCALPDASNVSRLLEYLALSAKRLAVELNGEIVPRSRFAEQKLADGDKVEIVVAVGGG